MFLCVEGGVDGEGEARAPSLLVACVAYWAHIPWPFPFAHLDAWILLLPGGSFQYGIVIRGKKSESDSLSPV